MNVKLQVEEEQVKPHQKTALHLISGCGMLVAFLLLAIVFRRVSDPVYYGLVAVRYVLLAGGLALLFLSIFKNRRLLAPNVNPRVRVIEVIVALSLCVAMLIGQAMLLAGLYGVLAACLVYGMYAEAGKTAPSSVHIDERGVSVPGMAGPKLLRWTELERVLLRSGVLTLDCADNRLMQWQIAGSGVSATELEHYCSERIEQERDKRVADW